MHESFSFVRGCVERAGQKAQAYFVNTILLGLFCCGLVLGFFGVFCFSSAGDEPWASTQESSAIKLPLILPFFNKMKNSLFL